MCKYKCSKCGSEELSFEKYVKCIIELEQNEDGTYEELGVRIDKEDFLPVNYGYACSDCGHPLELWGFRIECERELQKYLAMAPDVRAEEDRRYQEYLKEQCEAQKQREKEREEALEEELRVQENAEKDEAA